MLFLVCSVPSHQQHIVLQLQGTTGSISTDRIRSKEALRWKLSSPAEKLLQGRPLGFLQAMQVNFFMCNAQGSSTGEKKASSDFRNSMFQVLLDLSIHPYANILHSIFTEARFFFIRRNCRVQNSKCILVFPLRMRVVM